MEQDPKSIGEQIDSLAQLTGAPESFVDQVRDLFAKTGISLEEDATPYLRALEEPFIREESIRASTERAQESVCRTSQQFDQVGKAYVEQIERLRRVHSGQPAPGPGPGGERAGHKRTQAHAPQRGHGTPSKAASRPPRRPSVPLLPACRAVTACRCCCVRVLMRFLLRTRAA